MISMPCNKLYFKQGEIILSKRIEIVNQQHLLKTG